MQSERLSLNGDGATESQTIMASSEYGYGIYRGAGGVVKAQRANGYHELPTIPLLARLGHRF